MITIMLDQVAIEKALTNYVGETALGLDLSSKEINISLIAGRGSNGMRAEITLADDADQSVDSVVEDEAESSPAQPDTPEKVVEPFDFNSTDD